MDKALMNCEKAFCAFGNTFKAEVVKEVVMVPPFTLAALQGVPMLPIWTPLSYFQDVMMSVESILLDLIWGASTYSDDDVLLNRIDGQSDTGDGNHGGDNVVGGGGGCPWVGRGKVHRHLVDGNGLDQAEVNLKVQSHESSVLVHLKFSTA